MVSDSTTDLDDGRPRSNSDLVEAKVEDGRWCEISTDGDYRAVNA